MSCELGSQGLKVARENFEIGKLGMTNMKTGEVIVGNLTEEDLEYGEILGNGASGYVYAAIHRPTGRKVALKSINVFDKGKRHQLVNDLKGEPGEGHQAEAEVHHHFTVVVTVWPGKRVLEKHEYQKFPIFGSFVKARDG